jgi:hypothetical protein
MQQNQPKNPKRRVPDWRTSLPLARSALRCGARTRSGNACRGPGMANGKCRLHGGASTGPRTAEGIERIRRARTIHGRYSAEATELRRIFGELKRLARETIAALE